MCIKQYGLQLKIQFQQLNLLRYSKTLNFENIENSHGLLILQFFLTGLRVCANRIYLHVDKKKKVIHLKLQILI